MSIEEARKRVLIPMSNEEIENYGFRFLTYSDLSNYNSIVDLLPNKTYDSVIILVRTKINYGHFLCVVRLGNRILFFDSYGYRPDKKFYNTSEYMRRKINQDIPLMSYFLNEALDKGFKVSFSEYKFQDPDIESNTCGRWCVLFCKYFKVNINKSIKDFICFVLNESKKYDNIDLNLLVSMLVP